MRWIELHNEQISKHVLANKIQRGLNTNPTDMKDPGRKKKEVTQEWGRLHNCFAK